MKQFLQIYQKLTLLQISVIKVIKYIIFCIIIISLINSCSLQKSSRERFVLSSINNTKQLKLDGYYLRRDSTGNVLTRYYLYKNGKILQLYSNSSKELFESYPDSMRITNFFIKNDTIGFEQIFPWNAYPHYLYNGYILNDSTFTITNEKPLRHTDMFEKKVNRSDTFHFEQTFKK